MGIEFFDRGDAELDLYTRAGCGQHLFASFDHRGLGDVHTKIVCQGPGSLDQLDGEISGAASQFEHRIGTGVGDNLRGQMLPQAEVFAETAGRLFRSSGKLFGLW